MSPKRIIARNGAGLPLYKPIVRLSVVPADATRRPGRRDRKRELQRQTPIDRRQKHCAVCNQFQQRAFAAPRSTGTRTAQIGWLT